MLAWLGMQCPLDSRFGFMTFCHSGMAPCRCDDGSSFALQARAFRLIQGMQNWLMLAIA